MTRALNSRTRSLVWAFGFYFVLVVTAAAQPFVYSYDSSAVYLMRFANAIPPSFWVIYDAKSRGLFVPHVVQPAVLNFWYIVAPLYMLTTRKWWGLLYCVVHCALVFAIWNGTYIAVVWLVWGPDAF